MITVIDSGGANLSSVLFALDRLGVKNRLSRDPEVIRRSEKLILPGVGAAGSVMGNLRALGLVDSLRALKQPVLGICLGMQILYERSEEGDVECLGVIPGTVKKLVPGPGLTVPHMGWNEVRCLPGRADCPLFPAEVSSESFYFVHSFVAPAGNAVQAVAIQGVEIPAIVQSGNWFGVQFHPERSGAAGARLLARFAGLEPAQLADGAGRPPLAEGLRP
jgi:glutamine amidotransferase